VARCDASLSKFFQFRKMRKLNRERHEGTLVRQAGSGARSLEVRRLPTLQARPGEGRIKLEASAVNPSDTYRRAGPADAMEYPRVIVNSNGAGIVDHIGPGAKRFKVGDRVWLYNGQRNGRAFGTAAEYIALDEKLVTPLPGNVSFAEGATLSGYPA
jgi:NADPH:quinone reductase